jgi:TetR/AcrR family transcriptional regulator, cholesterol catabolism regulator
MRKATVERQASRREEILDVAARLFQNGYLATSLDDVAAEIGITRPALYYYFRSKEDILAAIYERAVGALIDRASLILAEKLPPDVLLCRLVEAHVRTMLKERPIVRVFFQEKHSLGEEAARSVKAKEVAFTKMLAATIRSGQKSGVFRPGNPALVVNAILGMLIWLYQWYRPERYDAAEIETVFCGLILRGVAGNPNLKGSASPFRRAS